MSNSGTCATGYDLVNLPTWPGASTTFYFQRPRPYHCLQLQLFSTISSSHSPPSCTLLSCRICEHGVRLQRGRGDLQRSEVLLPRGLKLLKQRDECGVHLAAGRSPSGPDLLARQLPLRQTRGRGPAQVQEIRAAHAQRKWRLQERLRALRCRRLRRCDPGRVRAHGNKLPLDGGAGRGRGRGHPPGGFRGRRRPDLGRQLDHLVLRWRKLLSFFQCNFSQLCPMAQGLSTIFAAMAGTRPGSRPGPCP